MSGDTAPRRATWDAIGVALTAHAVMLRDTAIIDEQVAAALLTAVDGVRRGDPPDVPGSLALVAIFDERVDSLSAADAAGAGLLGRARHDLAATAARLVLRDRLLALVEAVDAARAALLDLAESHVFTLMAAWSGSSPLQPTNFAHFLTGAIAPLGRAAARLRVVYGEVNRTPLGAAALAGPALAVDRDGTADLLGAEGPVESTFDAVSGIDHLVSAIAAAAAAVAPMAQLITELILWSRTDPNAVRFADPLLATPDPALPQFRPPAVLERLIADARAVAADAATVARQAWDIPYGAAGEQGDAAAATTTSALARATSVAESFATMVSGPIEINRAWLARNAGHGHVTSGDLAAFLMSEEGLPPLAAREISSLTAGRAMQDGLEAMAIDPGMIDAAALMVIGRELGIEIERLGAYLAPRRFIEKRTMLGGPAAPAVRDYLEIERLRLEADRHWLSERRRRLALATENLAIRSHEIIAAASSG